MRPQQCLSTLSRGNKDVDTTPPLIALVDDDVGVGQATMRLLTAAGSEAPVFDSAEALDASGCARTADCLVLDMRLPGVCVGRGGSSTTRRCPGRDRLPCSSRRATGRLRSATRSGWQLAAFWPSRPTVRRFWNW